MSIPQICPSCGSHISAAHAKDCCYGTPEYAHLGWADTKPISTMKSLPLTSILGTPAPAYQVADYLTSREDGVMLHSTNHPSDLLLHGAGKPNNFRIKEPDPDTASAIRRLLDYLNEEPEDSEPSTPASQEVSDKGKILCRLSAKANELRKEADGISSIYTLARSNRNFAADILEGLLEELNAE